ncbi:MAG TPA: addiction module antidote protein [Blastocatellia bacterium]|nr:addiction module antidote protein [Blastocatellia bacterium]
MTDIRKTKTLDEVMADYLSDPDDLAEYINTSIEEGRLTEALGRVARVYGIGKLAEQTSLNRENLYKMLADGSNPSLKSLEAVLDSLGLQIKVEPKKVA